MIDLYTWTTANGYKPLILLAELGMEYNLHPVNLGKKEQLDPAYLRINPNGKIPALVEGAGTPEEVVVFESGAILLHLAEKTGRFLPPPGPERARALSWLMFQMGNVGPMFGQLAHFLAAKEAGEYALGRFRAETERLYGVLDRHLGEAEYLAGDYGIADIATYPWARLTERLCVPRERFPNVCRWLDAVGARPAVLKALATKMA